MTNWYSKNLYKEANALARSLSLDSSDEYFKLIQKNEQQLKSDGSWHKIMNTRRKEGREAAIDLLGDILGSYVMDLEKNPPQKVHHNIRHIGRSFTGGDWFLFDNPGDLKNPESHNVYETEEYEEAHQEAYSEIVEEYKEFVDNKIQEKKDEIETMIERLNEDKNIYSEEEYHKKLEEYRLEMKKIKGIESDLDNSYAGPEEIDEALVQLGYDSENIQEMIDERAYQTAEENASYGDFYGARDALETITCSGHWCISPGGMHINDFIEEGNNALVLRKDGKPRCAIAFDDDGDIDQIQGVNNKFYNLDIYDILDIMNCPYFDQDNILEAFEEQGDNFDKETLEAIMSISDDEIKRNKNLLKALEHAKPIVEKIIDFDFEEGRPSEAIETILEVLGDPNNEQKLTVYNTILSIAKEKMKSHALEDPEYFMEDLLDYYDDAYDVIYRELFGDFPDNLIIIWLKQYYASIKEPNTENNEDWPDLSENLENMKSIFGEDRINRFLELLEDKDYVSFSGIDPEGLREMIISGRYREIDISKFINNKEYLNWFMNNLTQETITLLANNYQLPQTMKYMSAIIDFAEYISNLNPNFSYIYKDVKKHFYNITFNKIRGEHYRYQECSEKEAKIEELRRLGLDGRILNELYAYHKGLGCFKNNNPEAPVLVEGLPMADPSLAPDNNMQTQLATENKVSNWYKNEKFIRYSYK